MKTIFLPIYNGIRAKNFFRTDVYQSLIKDRDIRLIVTIPSVKLDFYREEFKDPNVVFVPLDIMSEPWLGRFLSEIAFNSLNTITIRFKQKLEYYKFHKPVRFAVKKLINFVSRPFPEIRFVLRFLDRFVPLNPEVAAVLEKYQPDLVLAPDIVFPMDRIFIRAAKRAGYKVVGLTRSWDNLTSKGVIQVLPDKLVLHTERMKKQAVKLVGMPEKDIYVSGPPDFDDYFKPRKKTREEFLRSLSIDPANRVVLLSPFYDDYNGSASIIINEVLKAYDQGRFPKDVHFLVRYRPASPEIKEGLYKSPAVTFTKPCSRFFKVKYKVQMPTKDWEFTAGDVELLVNSISYSDVLVTTFSTIGIDAAACDKPIIGIRYDAEPNTSKIHSILAIADAHDHYRELERSGGIKLVYSTDELIDAINLLLKNPAEGREGRLEMKRQQIQFFDGQNGRRAADFIKSQI